MLPLYFSYSIEPKKSIKATTVCIGKNIEASAAASSQARQQISKEFSTLF